MPNQQSIMRGMFPNFRVANLKECADALISAPYYKGRTIDPSPTAVGLEIGVILSPEENAQIHKSHLIESDGTVEWIGPTQSKRVRDFVTKNGIVIK